MYNKQVWKDEIPDLARPILDGSGKQKTDPQTGRPLFELVQEGTRITSARLNTMEGGIEAAHTLVEQMSKELGGNFVAVIDGVMGLQCSAQGLTVTWTTGVAYVGGRRYEVSAGNMPLNPTQGQYLYVDVDGIVKKTTSQATAKKGLLLFYVATDTSGVISSKDHRVNISMEEIMNKIDSAVTTAALDATAKADAARVSAKTYTDDQVKGIADRLDIEERQDVVLDAGVQILNSQSEAIYSLSGIKGRALINQLGVMGALDSVTNLGEFQVDLAIETIDKVQGTGSLKVTLETDMTSGAGFIGQVKYTSGKYYIAVANVKNVNAAHAYIAIAGVTSGTGNIITDTTKWSTSFVRFNPSVNTTANLDFGIKGTGGQSALFDAARVYEISKTAYDEIPNLTADQVAAKYPFVGNIKPVRNPYAIRYGENLLANFPEAKILFYNAPITPIQIHGSYEIKFAGEATSTNVDKGVYVDIPVIPGKTYTAAVDTLADNGYIRFEYWKDANSINPALWVKQPDFFLSNTVATVTVPAGCTFLRVYFTNQRLMTYNNGTLTNESLIGGNYHFKNWRLFVGTKDLGFKPREDAMLSIQTDLFADPVTGLDADEIFVKDGQYLKLEKWQRTLMSNLNWELQYNTGVFKTLRAKGRQISFIDSTASGKFLVKWNGGFIPFIYDDFSSGTESFWNSTYEGGTLFIKVNQSDSGWGDSYTPTPDEFRAYFLGWKMYDGSAADNPYNGTGPKFWRYMNIPVTDATTTTGTATATVPTTMVPGFTPYELVSKRPTQIVTAVKTEGLLTLFKGDNQIEVGSNMILREQVTPKGTTSGSGNKLEINYRGYDIDTRLNHPLTKFIAIYKDGVDNTGKWSIGTNANANGGKYYAECLIGDFDKSASYSVTYLSSESSLSAPFNGSYTTNEKSFFQQLLTNVEYLMSNPVGGKDNGAEYKANVVAALNSIGVEATTGLTWPQLFDKIKGIIVAKGNVEAYMVFQGKSFSSEIAGSNIIGTFIPPTRNSYAVANEQAVTATTTRNVLTFMPSNRYIDLYINTASSTNSRGLYSGTRNTGTTTASMSSGLNLIDSGGRSITLAYTSGAATVQQTIAVAIDGLRIDRVSRTVAVCLAITNGNSSYQSINVPTNFDFTGTLSVQSLHMTGGSPAVIYSQSASMVFTS